MASEKSEQKVSLFDLHRKVKIIEIEDEESGTISTFALKAPSYAVNNHLNELLIQYRQDAEKEADSRDLRGKLAVRVQEFPVKAIIDMILTMERPTALENADLAPVEGKTPEQQDEEAVTAYAERRRPELEAIEQAEGGRGVLNALYVDMQARLVASAMAMNRYLNTQLVHMVVDPDTQKPMLTEDPDEDNFIGNLMPETREALNLAREKFLEELTEKSIRRNAENPTLSLSGRSRKRRRGSPGGTTESTPTSPPVTSDSSVAVSG